MCFRRGRRQVPLAGVHDKLAAGRVNDWPEEGICSSPVSRATASSLSATAARWSAPTEGLAAGNKGVTDEKYKSKTDGDVIWRLDMIGKLGVFPHNLAICSPLIVGDTLFVITSNGVDEGHINIPAPEAPSFLAVDKKTGKVLWQNNCPPATGRARKAARTSRRRRQGDPDARPVVQPGLRRAERQAADHLPRRRRLDPRLRPQERQADLEVRLQPEGVASTSSAAEGTRNDFVCHAGRLGQQALHRRRPGPRAQQGRRPSVVHRHHQGAEEQGQGPVAGARKNDNFDPKDAGNKDSGLVWHYGGRARGRTTATISSAAR